MTPPRLLEPQRPQWMPVISWLTLPYFDQLMAEKMTEIQWRIYISTTNVKGEVH